MIEVKNLTKAYPGVVAVDDISFSIERGEVVGFLGPNGAGKSTTMRILTCFIPPTRGTVRVGGHDVIRDSMKVRRMVGYLPETNPLYPEMRVEEYLYFRARIKKVARGERMKRIGEAIEACGLTERRRSIIGNLSKGLKQRVGLADSILHEPDLVILDEPTQGLDPIQVREVRKLILDVGEKRTVMLSTHILSEVEKVCSRVIIINVGKIVASGTPREITNSLTRTGQVRVEARGDVNAMNNELHGLAGVGKVSVLTAGDVHTFSVESKDGTDIRPLIFRLMADQGWELRELAYEQMSLEDAFAELTSQPVKKKEKDSGEKKKGGKVGGALRGLFRG